VGIAQLYARSLCPKVYELAMRSMSRQLIFTLHNCCSYVQSNFIKSNMKLARYCFIVLLVGLFSGCEVKDIQLVEVESVKVLNVNKGNIDGILNIKLENPNAFGQIGRL
jgi:hypothetical protein